MHAASRSAGKHAAAAALRLANYWLATCTPAHDDGICCRFELRPALLFSSHAQLMHALQTQLTTLLHMRPCLSALWVHTLQGTQIGHHRPTATDLLT